MKKNWKCWLGTVAAAMLGGSVMAQAPQYPAAGPDFGFDGEGSIRMGTESGSVVVNPAQYPGYQPVDADAIWQEAPRAYQGAPPPQDDSVGFASATSFADVQYRVGRVNNDQYGFQGGYTTLNAFIPIATDGMNMWFFDPRLNITDFGEGAASLGLGYRRYSPTMDRIFGISGWYDYDPGHRGEYSQAGLSLENIGRYFSTRFNANIPFEDSNQYTTANSFGTPFFQGNNIAYLFNFLREITYQQYQLEAAAPIPFLGRYGGEWALSAYGLVGADQNAKDALGIAGRFEFQVSEDFWINTIVSHDRIFGTNTSINFELTIPSGVQTRWLRPKKVQEKLLASVKRPYRVSADTVSLQETQFFLDQRDGNPIVVAHIDPTAANGTASGSVTNPFGSVADYMADPNRGDFDIIFVGRNALATDDTDLNTGIELLTGQRLLGTGALADGSVHEFHFIDRGDGVTTLDLPGFANGTAQSTGPNPFLTNSAAPVGTPVVSLNGNITEVSGFTIDASGTADGIATPFATAVDGFVITNNTFQNAIDAVDITSNTSAALGFDTTLPPSRFGGENFGIVTSNTINGTGALPVTNGIVIDHIAGTGAEDLNLLIGQNTINGVTNIGINVNALGGTLDGNDPAFGLQSNIIDSTGQGILATSTGIGTVFNLSVQGNEITNSTNVVDPLNPELGAGMGFLAQAGSQMNFNVVSDNVVTNAGGAGGRGAAFVAESAGIMTFSPIVAGQSAFFQNTFSGNADDGALFSADGAGTNLIMNSPVVGNTFTNNGGNGLNLQATNTGTVSFGPIVANTISGNTENGINGTANGGTVNVQVGSTASGVASPINGNTLNGINLESANGGTMNANIQAVNVFGNTVNGVRLASSGGTTNVVMNGTAALNNTITGNGGDGVNISGSVTGTVNLNSARFNTITLNAGDGIDVNLIDDATANLFDLSANTISNNVGLGINVNTQDTSDFLLQMGVTGAANGSNILNANGDAGIGIQTFDTSTGDVNIAFTNITGTVDRAGTTDFLGDGIRAITNDSSRLDTFVVGGTNPNVPDVNITGNAGRGVAIETRISSVVVAPTIRNSAINGNTLDGIEINRFANSKIDNIAILNNQLIGNLQDGIEFNLTGGRVDIEAPATALIIDALIMDNIITGATASSATSDGIAMNLSADVLLNANIMDNEITAMGNAGIIARASDDANIDGVWSNNTVRGNGLNGAGLERDGINITLTQRAQAGLNSAGFGTAPIPPNPQGLIIELSEVSGSGRDGIRIESGNAVSNAPDSNILIRNNAATVADPLDGIYGNAGSGIHIISQGGATLEPTDSDVTVNNNQIRNNALDGILVEAFGIANGTWDQGTVSGQATLDATGNQIRNNGRDGVSLTTEDNSVLTATLLDNNIALNGRRGVNLLNRHNSFSSLTIDGTVDPTLTAGTVATSRIEQNGETGVLVVNDAQNIDTGNSIVLNVFDTAIVGNGTNLGALADDRNGLYIRTGTSSSGVINADIQRNFMSGNGNIDFVTESFVSVPQAQIPVITPYFGTNAAYREDPLARLALRFIDNVGDQIDVTRQGAFYTNADQFKSPEAFFTSNTRRRNAQRISVDYPPGVAGDTNPFPVVRNVTTAAANVNSVVINADATFGGQVPQGNGQFNGLGVIINGVVRNATYNTGNNTLTFDGPAASFAVGDPITFVAFNIAGVGASTFRTSETAVNVNNQFTTVISDFTALFPIDLGAPNINNNPLFNGNSQDFGWETADPNAPFYVFP